MQVLRRLNLLSSLLVLSGCAATHSSDTVNSQVQCTAPVVDAAVVATTPVEVPTALPRLLECAAVTTVDVQNEGPAGLPALQPVPRGGTTPLARACDQLGRTADTLRARALGAGPVAPDSPRARLGEVLDPVGRCYAAGTGAWAITARNVHKDTTEGMGDAIVAETSLVWVNAQGRSTALTAFKAPLSSGNVSDDAVTPRFTFDYDGDGNGELVLEISGHMTDEDHWSSLAVYKVNATGTPAVWATGGNAKAIKEFRDVDKDGRPDIVMASAFSYESPCGLDGITYMGPDEVRHSLANGTFVPDDDVSRSFLRLSCTELPTHLVVPSTDPDSGEPFDPQQSIKNIACAAIMGVPAYALERQIAKEYEKVVPYTPTSERAGENDCLPFAPLLSSATAYTEVHLPPECPAP